MIGPEARKVDHIKEHVEMGEENGSDFTEGKAHSDGHGGRADGYVEKLEEGRGTHSEDTIENRGIGKTNHPEKTIE